MMEDKLLHIPQMLLIGSAGRNSGKTTLAVELIQQWKNLYPVIGLKVTTIHENNGKCPRGGEGCGVCSSLKESYKIVEEININKQKDTSRLLEAGAEKVYWIKALKTHIFEAVKDFMTQIPENKIIICESNSVRKFVRPGTFIMINNTVNGSIKESAKQVIDKADFIIDYNFEENSREIIDRIEAQEVQGELIVKMKK